MIDRAVLRLGLVPWGSTIEEMADAAATAERAGADSVWAPEMHRTPFVPLAAVASRTRTVTLGTGIALAFVRSPMTTALEALDLDEVSGGRLVLGLGTGVTRLNTDWHNVDPGKPAPHLRETIGIIRTLWSEMGSGRAVDHHGDWERIRLRGYRRPLHQERMTIPIHVAAMGPALTRLAGEIADGWMAHELGSPHFLAEVATPRLREGWERAGRDRTDLTVVASACCVIHPDRREARRRMAGLIAFYASVKTYAGFFAWHGFETEARVIQERFRTGDLAGMIDAVTDEMIDTLTLTGTADDVRAGIARYQGVADIVKLSPPTHNVDDDVIRDAQSSIFDLFQG